jgi:anaerobic magnesium-protoporphyrin IX monomethyl ester cyclase
MLKILFINPVVREEDVPRHIPYGIALLASIAKNCGHQVQIYDANAWRKSDNVLKEVCMADSWDVIAVGGLTTTYGYIKKTVKIAKQNSPNSFIIAGGGFITAMPHDIMEWLPMIDVGAIGESFVTFPEILEKIDCGDLDFSKTLGVIWRDKDGTPVLNEARPIINNLDTLPYPAWDMFPLEEVYFKNSSALFSEDAYTAKRRIDINGSFGCRFVCRYCWHLGTTGDMLVTKNEEGINDVQFTYGRNIRYHSPEYIINMVKELKERYDIDQATFLDENLMTMDVASGRTWLNEICDLWISEGLAPNRKLKRRSKTGVYWSGTSHASLHKPDILNKMYESGCTQLVYGLESFDPGILNKLGKGSNRKNNISSVSICLESGIIPVPNIIIGFPEETFESIRNTITALIKLGIHAKPHFATAYPGSEWYYKYKNAIIKQYNGSLENYILDLGDASTISGTISENFSAMELIGLQELVKKRDLRALDIAEKHYNKTRINNYKIHESEESFNFVPKKLDGLIESIST